MFHPVGLSQLLHNPRQYRQLIIRKENEKGEGEIQKGKLSCIKNGTPEINHKNNKKGKEWRRPVKKKKGQGAKERTKKKNKFKTAVHATTT